MKANKKVIKKFNHGGKHSEKEPRVSLSSTNSSTSESTTRTNRRGKKKTTTSSSNTRVSTHKHPDGEKPNTTTTSVNTVVFKPKIFGSGTRRRGTSTTSTEVLNEDGTQRSHTYSKKKVKRPK